VVHAIFKDLVENFEPEFAKVQKVLPKGFPEELTNSISVAAIQRIGLLSDT
jgi:serine/threonine-protein kinase HipA